MNPDAVHQQYNDSDAVIKRLKDSGEISLAVSAEATLTKVLILSAASYFEAEIQALVAEFCKEVTNGHPELCALVQNRVISRQYHTYFDWERSNVNKFLSMFGEDFKQALSKDIGNDQQLAEAVRNFMAIGSTRNQLVHLNFVSCPIDVTSEEIHQQFTSALAFVDHLRKSFAHRSQAEKKQTH